MARLSRLLLLPALLASAPARGQGLQGAGLHDLAVAAGLLFFGTATDTNLFNDSSYMALVNDQSQFGLLVPENSQKWQPTEPLRNDFVFANPDRVRNLTQTNRQMLRCHTLTWFQQLPTFVENGTWTADNLTAVINAHISNVVGHFRGSCYSWDVVNEALNDDGTFRDSVFFETMGTDFIPISFRAAAAADPNAKLYYNDFNLENNGTKTVAALGIVQIVRDSGLTIDGVGFQAHMTVGQTPSRRNMAAVLRRFTDLGLEVAMTELDIRHNALPPTDQQIAQQATDYVSMVGACVDTKGCVGVVVWEFTDKYSWIPSTFPGAGDACLLDQNLVPKPAFSSVSSLLRAAATGAPSPANSTGLFGGVASPTPTQSMDMSGMMGMSAAPRDLAAVRSSALLAALMFVLGMLLLH